MKKKQLAAKTQKLKNDIDVLLSDYSYETGIIVEQLSIKSNFYGVFLDGKLVSGSGDYDVKVLTEA